VSTAERHRVERDQVVFLARRPKWEDDFKRCSPCLRWPWDPMFRSARDGQSAPTTDLIGGLQGSVCIGDGGARKGLVPHR
jgi:hypothetical protein